MFCLLYWLLPRLLRLYLLLIGSVVFYGFWSFYFVPLMFVSVLIDYLIAPMIAKEDSQKRKKFYLWLSIGSNLSLLFYFKYLYFFTDSVAGLFKVLGYDWSVGPMSIVLPIGISFYTFQSMSYSIDVYRNKIKPVKDFVLFANYITFFPQLVAGPILRANEVIWQLNVRPVFKISYLHNGFRRVILGLALKVLFADNLAPFVNEGFSANSNDLSVIDVITLAFLFGFQIYFDFAAYSQIAKGTAEMVGVKFPDNFKFPYHASSPRDFWRRWHITLSNWIKDYLYVPLISKSKHENTSINLFSVLVLFFTWALMGLWHGASWNFVVWGCWHAVLVLFHRLIILSRFGLKSNIFINGFGRFVTLILIMLAWIPFRSDSLFDTMNMFNAFFDPKRWMYISFHENTYLVAAITFICVAISPIFWRFIDFYEQRFKIVSFIIFTLVSVLVLIFLQPLDQFIYFQF